MLKAEQSALARVPPGGAWSCQALYESNLGLVRK